MVDNKTFYIDDLRKILNWYDSLEIPDKSNFVNIETTETGIGTAIRVFLETHPGEGLWKNFTDYESW